MCVCGDGWGGVRVYVDARVGHGGGEREVMQGRVYVREQEMRCCGARVTVPSRLRAPKPFVEYLSSKNNRVLRTHAYMDAHIDGYMHTYVRTDRIFIPSSFHPKSHSLFNILI